MDVSGSTSTGKRRVRGSYYGAGMEKEIKRLRRNGITHLQVEFDPNNGDALGRNGKWLKNNMAHLVRNTFSPLYTRSKDVPEAEIQIIYERLSEKFLFSLNDKSKDFLEQKMQKYMNEWRGAMKRHWVEVGGEMNNEAAKTCPYKNVSQSDWVKLCDHFASNSQQRISERNKANRAKMTMLGGHGSKSIVAHIHESVDESGKLPSMIDTFKQLHQKNESWQSEKARKAYHEMTQRRASQSTHTTASSSASCVGGDDARLPPDLDIVIDVLGHRSRYKKGFGPLPRLKAFGGQRAQSSASKSTTEADVEKLREENKQFKQNFIVQQECMMNMMKQIQQMQQQMQSVNPGFSFNMGQQMSMPPPPLFDNAATSHLSYSVEQQENDNDNHADAHLLLYIHEYGACRSGLHLGS